MPREPDRRNAGQPFQLQWLCWTTRESGMPSWAMIRRTSAAALRTAAWKSPSELTQISTPMDSLFPAVVPACQHRTSCGKDCTASASSTLQCHDAWRTFPELWRLACAAASAPRPVFAVSCTVIHRRAFVPLLVLLRLATSWLLVFTVALITRCCGGSDVEPQHLVFCTAYGNVGRLEVTVAGLMSWFTRSIPETQIPARYAVQTPWAEDNLTANVLLADAFGITTEIATRQNAMSIPAIAKARHIITSTVAAAVWKAYKGDAELGTQPPFLYRTNSAQTPVHRMIWTVDDLLFYGWSLWAVTRGAGREILDAVRIPRERWDFDSVGRVLVDGEITQEGEVVLIPASDLGLILNGSATILGALNLEREWQKRIRNPIAVTELHVTDANDPLTPEESKKLAADFNASRRTQDGVTMVTPANVEIRTHGAQVTDLFIAGRNAVAIDVARLVGLPALVLDTANINAANQNYSNKDTARNDLLDAIRNVYIAPIEARLSQDDVVARGQSIRADLSNAISVPDTGTGAPKED